MKATMLMLLGLGFASLGLGGCAAQVTAEDEEATVEEQTVDSAAQAICRRDCRRTCFIRRGRRVCQNVCRTICR